MSDGKTHARASATAVLVSGIAAIPASVMLGPAIPFAFVGGMMAGWLMSPDLDLPVRTEDEKRMLRKGHIWGIFWVGFWASYGQMFRHRGVSHWPIIGTLTRVLWLFRHAVMLFVALLLLQYLGFIRILIVPQVQMDLILFLSFLFGWIIQDFVHLALDGILL